MLLHMAHTIESLTTYVQPSVMCSLIKAGVVCHDCWEEEEREGLKWGVRIECECMCGPYYDGGVKIECECMCVCVCSTRLGCCHVRSPR